ncbi:MAG: hypothetical protein AB1486_07350 [Planctomycetota bacterium]
MKRTVRVISFWSWVFLLALSPLALAQPGADKDLGKLVRDQRAIGERLSRLKDKMERLSETLDREQKVTSAALLRKAVRAVEEANLRNMVDDVSEELEQGRLQAIEKQERLLKVLEEIYAILLDRNDLDKLNEQLEKIREGLRSLETLSEAEARLRGDTEELAASEAERLARAKEKLRELIASQQRLREEAVARESPQGLDALREARSRLEAAEAAQGRAYEATLEGLQEGLRRLREHLAEAARREGIASRGLDQLAAKDGSGSEERPARESEAEGDIVPPEEDSVERGLFDEQAAALSEVGKAREVLDRELELPANEETAAQGPASLQELGDVLEAARSAMTASQRAISEGLTSQAAAKSREALQALDRARAALESSTSMGEASAQAAGATQEAADQARESAKSALEETASGGEEPLEKALEEAGAAVAEAEAHAKEAREGLSKRQPLTAAEAQQAAGEALREAREALEEALASASERAEAETRGLAGRQDMLRSETEELRNEVERLDEVLDPESRSRAGDALAGAGRSMNQARRSLADRDYEAAHPQQDQARQSLEEAEAALEQGRPELERQDPAARSEEFREQANRQDEIEAATRELMGRLEDLKTKGWKESAQSAREAMNRASRNLTGEEADQAVTEEREAEKELREAAEKLREDERQYESLRQEELFFRIKKELSKLRDDQVEIMQKLEELSAGQDEAGGRLRRSDRRRVRELGAEEKGLASATREVEEKIRQDGSRVFTYILGRNIQDLEEVATLLDSTEPELDAYTLGIGHSVIRRFDELLLALDEEMERARQAARQQEEQAEPPPDAELKRSLVPPVAELLMIRRLEVNVREELRIFMAENAGQELDEIDLEILRRLGHEHSSLTQLFDELVNAARQESGAGGGSGSDEEGG